LGEKLNKESAKTAAKAAQMIHARSAIHGGTQAAAALSADRRGVAERVGAGLETAVRLRVLFKEGGMGVCVRPPFL
jgi:hypothetical protein